MGRSEAAGAHVELASPSEMTASASARLASSSVPDAPLSCVSRYATSECHSLSPAPRSSPCGLLASPRASSRDTSAADAAGCHVAKRSGSESGSVLSATPAPASRSRTCCSLVSTRYATSIRILASRCSSATSSLAGSRIDAPPVPPRPAKSIALMRGTMPSWPTLWLFIEYHLPAPFAP